MMNRKTDDTAKLFLAASLVCLLCACTESTHEPEWTPIFDGLTLDGWTMKFAGEPVGEDKNQTFRVKDNSLVVSYENYDKFDRHFGHLFYNKKLSHYRLRLEYRFVGEVMPDAPKYTILNSGVMLHAQGPQDMEFTQEFPASVEAQLLASHAQNPARTTVNICTPGTHVFIDGALQTKHCIRSNTVGAPLNEWVHFEAEVMGNDYMAFFINGKKAFELAKPQWDRSDKWGETVAGSDTEIRSGYLALQAEGQPVEFRNIQLIDLSN